MIGRVFILTILCTSVLSLPVTSGQLENEDVKVMKCIVEALADVLSRPHPMPVSQDCLLTLKTDDRLVAILRHHNFLKELQEIAFQGGQKRAQEDAPGQETKTQIADDIPDRSMLEALGGPGEQSVLSQKKRLGSEEDGERSEEAKEVLEKRDGPEEDNAKTLLSMEDWSDTEKRDEEKRGHKEKKGSEHNEKRDSSMNKSQEEEKDKKSTLHSQKEVDIKADEVKRGRLKLWSKRAKTSQMEKKAAEKETHEEEEVPHHSKEVLGEEEVAEKKRSPEEKELQMIARTTPEEKRGSEEEGSGNRKEADIESLATIESELESVAQKLHNLSEADRKRG